MPLALQRDVGYPGRLVPFLTTLMLALLSVLPFNLPGFAVVTPAFALMAVFHWTVYRPDLLPLTAVFIVGVLVDLFNGTPYVGISAAILLLARYGLTGVRRYFVNRTFTVVWLGFLVVAVACFAVTWILVSLLHGAVLGIRPFVFQAVLTVSCYPFVSYALAWAQRAFLTRA